MNRVTKVGMTGGLAALALSGTLLLCDGSAVGVKASPRNAREAGAALFHERGCEHCHGVNGVGTDKGPSLSTVGKQLKSAQIERQIREGGKGMPPFGSALQPDEVKSLVEYLKAKKKAPRDMGQGSPAVQAEGPTQ